MTSQPNDIQLNDIATSPDSPGARQIADMTLFFLLACAPEPQLVCTCGEQLQTTVAATGTGTLEAEAEELEEIQTALCRLQDEDCSCRCDPA